MRESYRLFLMGTIVAILAIGNASGQSASSQSLAQAMVGSWAIGGIDRCSSAPYQVSLAERILLFRDRTGKVTREAVEDDADDRLKTRALDAQGAQQNAIWIYQRKSTSTISVTNTLTGRSFNIFRCEAGPEETLLPSNRSPVVPPAQAASASAGAPVSLPRSLSPAELDVLQRRISEKWAGDRNARGIESFIVDIRVNLDASGVVNAAEIVSSQGAPADSLNSFAQSIRRAVLIASPLRLPPGRSDLLNGNLILSFKGNVFGNDPDEERRRQQEAQRQRQIEEQQARVRLEQEAAERRRIEAEREAQSRERAAVHRRAFEAYKNRPKHILEKVLNYQSFANEDGETRDPDNSMFWVSGEGGEKCVMTLRVPPWHPLNPSALGRDGQPLQPVLGGYMTLTYGQAKIDIREFNERGFRFSPIAAGDEKVKIPIFTDGVITPRPVADRLSRAWRLAFNECPGKRSEF